MDQKALQEKKPKINPEHEKLLENLTGRNKELADACTKLQGAIKSISQILNEQTLEDAHLKIGESAERIIEALDHLKEAGKHHYNNQTK